MQEVILIASWLEDEHVERIRAGAPWAEVVHASRRRSERTCPKTSNSWRPTIRSRRVSNTSSTLPSRLVDLLVRFLDQSHGSLSKRARSGEFAKLHEGEVARIEELF